MKILFLADAFSPHAGGSRVYYHHLYKTLAADFGHHVTVLTKKVAGWQEFDRQESSSRFRIIRRFKPLSSWRYHQWPKLAFPLVEAMSLVIRTRPDMLHSGDLYPQGVICLLLKRLLGIPYMAYCHGEEVTQTNLRRYQPRIRNAIYRNAEIVVAANEFARQQLSEIGIPDSSIEIIHPGVDYERFHPAPPKPDMVRQYGLEGKRVLLTVARLVPRKGHLDVIKALARVLPEVPETVYLIVGKGPEEARLRSAAAELGIGHAIRFVGYVPDEQLPDFYNVADLFVMPNALEASTGDVEGFGMVFLEANAAAKPVIAGKSGGTFDSVVDGVTGYLVEPNNVDSLSRTLSTLLQDTALRNRLGQAGLERVHAAFNWHRGAGLLHAVSARAAGLSF